MDYLVQFASLVGAVLILLGFVMLQRRSWASHSWSYLWVNFFGAMLLAIVAVLDRRIGFIILEIAWALVSVHGMLTREKPSEV